MKLAREIQLNVLFQNHMQLVTEKNKNNDRIAKLEDQMKYLNLNTQR